MASTVGPGAPGGAALARGLEALGQHAWTPAFEALSQADREGALGASGLEALAEAAWFTGQGDLAIDVKERAFGAWQAEGEPIRAGGLAVDLAHEYAYMRHLSVASGWLHRAERLLEGRDETWAHGFLALARAEGAMDSGVDHRGRRAGRGRPGHR